jgi:F-type H+-transporting ATPase subunit epsilon
MADTLRLTIVTPQETVFNEDVNMVTLPGIDGDMGIYPQHIRLITQIVPGEVIIEQNSQQKALAIGEGLVEVTGESVSIVTDMAIPSDGIDEAKAEEARRRAAARLEEKISDEEVASVNASLAKSLAQLKVKRRRGV